MQRDARVRTWVGDGHPHAGREATGGPALPAPGSQTLNWEAVNTYCLDAWCGDLLWHRADRDSRLLRGDDL